MRVSILALFLMVPHLVAAPLVSPKEILPADTKYDPAVIRPEKFFGFNVGERHLQHHEIVSYLKKLAETSPRVRLAEYGKTYGKRPLLVLTITAPENHKRLAAIREAHQQLADPRVSSKVDQGTLPAVIWMGYGVHGNEPSASNVAPLVAYHLAAGTGEKHEKLLRDVVVLLDPCLNPDGFERFAHWANNHSGVVHNSDPEHREHREAWPGGRTNYYWFDLNRDWLPAQHPESQGRLAIYHQWKPNLVLDFHEMGTNSTYFFQPGAPKRVHPRIPKDNLSLTKSLAKYHAKALDRIGSLYFTEEQFDDFYPGKGSTYPDLHGGVGILFEQASSRGLVQDSPNGKISFPFTIRNQFQTSLSSLAGLQALRKEFHELKRSFYLDAVEQAKKGSVRAHVVAAPGDPVRLHAFAELLHRHDIRVYSLAGNLTVDGRAFKPGEAYIIPTAQPESRFLEVLFERRTTFAENVFYDISTWTMPLAFNLQHAVLSKSLDTGLIGAAFKPGKPPEQSFTAGKDDIAYIIDWRSYAAPRTLERLVRQDVKVRVTMSPFRIRSGDNLRSFEPGTLVVPIGIQAEQREGILNVLRQAAKEGVSVLPVRDGLSLEGLKLGSSNVVAVPKAKVLLVTGEGVSQYEAGEVWHLLDQRLRMPITLVDTNRLSSVDLSKYSAVVLVSGTYAGVSTNASDRFQQYAEKGGTLIAIGTAITWLNSRGVVKVTPRSEPLRPRHPGRKPYLAAQLDAAEHLISGAIFEATVDYTHPLGFGFTPKEPVALFRNNRVILEATANPYSTPIVLTEKPLLSGYVSKENLARLGESASASVRSVGTGRVILLAENPNFRGFWYGTNRIFFNALFFGPITRVPETR